MGGESRGGESNRTGQERLSGICGAVAFVPQTHLRPSDIVNAWRRSLTQCRRRWHTETAFSHCGKTLRLLNVFCRPRHGWRLQQGIASLILRVHIFAATGNSVLSVKLHFPHICSKFITRGRSSASSINSIFYEFCPRQILAANGNFVLSAKHCSLVRELQTSPKNGIFPLDKTHGYAR